jgi:Leucine-rich repeat (LRR) protein
MGTSRSKTERQDYHQVMDKKYEENSTLYGSIPNDQYLCPKCDTIPQLINVHTDNGYLEFKCIKHGEIFIRVDNYLEKMKDSNTYYKERCCQCRKLQFDCKNEEIFKYCPQCKKTFCGEHAGKHIEENKSHEKMIILINEKNGKCAEHPLNECVQYCENCNKNLCSNCLEKHNGHIIKHLFSIQGDTDSKMIAEKNKILLNIIKFSDIVLETYRKCPYNYFHILNAKTLADSIRNENERNSEYINFAMKRFEKKFEAHKKSINELNKSLENFNVKINGEEEDLSLNNMNLNDHILKILCQICFHQLKKVDLSGNHFHDLKNLKDLDLSSLESLNLSSNDIENIDIFEYINMQNLKELYLHKNKIKDAKVLLKASLNSIKKIRLENNSFSSDLKELEKKFGSKLTYKAVTLSDFNKKYSCVISERPDEIRITDEDYGDIIIEELSLINANYDNLKSLTLVNCNIKDISSFKMISFKKLETLDLSLNKIKTIEVLAEINLVNLINLYLTKNEISDIYPLKFLKSKKLKEIFLEENPISKGKKKNKIRQ